MRARRLLGSGGRWEEEEESKLPFPGAAGEPPPPTPVPGGAPPEQRPARSPRGRTGLGRRPRGSGDRPFSPARGFLAAFCSLACCAPRPGGAGSWAFPSPRAGESEDLPRQLLVVLLPPKLPGIPPAPLRVCGRAGGWAARRNATPKCCHLPAHPRRGCAAAAGRPSARGGAALPSPRPCRQPLASPGDPPGRAVRSFSCPSSPPGRAAHAWLSLYNCGTARRG